MKNKFMLATLVWALPTVCVLTGCGGDGEDKAEELQQLQEKVAEQKNELDEMRELHALRETRALSTEEQIKLDGLYKKLAEEAKQPVVEGEPEVKAS